MTKGSDQRYDLNSDIIVRGIVICKRESGQKIYSKGLQKGEK